ncbi:hypothetical protein [Burkholderia ambifaria]|uniref:hypothetical protein n=1 Tax=Burkholderia ambifaria TaxID=152480 RepID=UPI001592ABE5|nr:hypothetical protein [Burkholderia ambifaria]
MKKTVFALAVTTATVFTQQALADVVVDVQAPGCVAKDPTGKPLVFATKPVDAIRIPRGTSFNDACLVDLPLSKDGYTMTSRIEKWLVRSEVEKREHVREADVQIVAPGVAKAAFHGGYSIVRFRFRDIGREISNCPVGHDSECWKQFRDNPSGFEVLSYQQHRVQ